MPYACVCTAAEPGRAIQDALTDRHTSSPTHHKTGGQLSPPPGTMADGDKGPASNVGTYLARRLQQIGCKDYFAVPGTC